MVMECFVASAQDASATDDPDEGKTAEGPGRGRELVKIDVYDVKYGIVYRRKP